MLYEEAAYDFSVCIINLLLLKATNDLFDLSVHDQTDHWIPRLHQVHNIKHVVSVTVPGRGA